MSLPDIVSITPVRVMTGEEGVQLFKEADGRNRGSASPDAVKHTEDGAARH